MTGLLADRSSSTNFVIWGLRLIKLEMDVLQNMSQGGK